MLGISARREDYVAFETIKFDDIAFTHLQELVDNGVSESRMLEYKAAMFGRNDEGRRETLKDLTAFANSDGGHLIIGITEKNGAVEFSEGIDTTSVDAEIQRLESLLRDAVEPRLIGYQIKSVPISSDRAAIVIHIPRSWTKPHRTNSKHFYVRNSNGVHEVSVNELRALFLSSQSEMDRIRRFVEDRIGALATGNGIMPLSATNLMALHVIPILSFLGNERIDVKRLNEEPHLLFPLIYNTGGFFRPNFDGFCRNSGNAVKVDDYTHIFRNWSIEAVLAGIERDFDGASRLIPPWIAKNIARSLTQYEAALIKNGVQYPLAVFVSLIGVKGATLDFRKDRYRSRQAPPINRDILTLPESILDKPPESEEQRAFRMKGTLDALWNAAGEIECPWFDENGVWSPTR